MDQLDNKIKDLCLDLIPTGYLQAIKLLNRYGLHKYHDSVRERKLFHAGLSYLNHHFVPLCTTKKSKLRLFEIVKSIRDDKLLYLKSSTGFKLYQEDKKFSNIEIDKIVGENKTKTIEEVVESEEIVRERVLDYSIKDKEQLEKYKAWKARGKPVGFGLKVRKPKKRVLIRTSRKKVSNTIFKEKIVDTIFHIKANIPEDKKWDLAEELVNFTYLPGYSVIRAHLQPRNVEFRNYYKGRKDIYCVEMLNRDKKKKLIHKQFHLHSQIDDMSNSDMDDILKKYVGGLIDQGCIDEPKKVFELNSKLDKYKLPSCSIKRVFCLFVAIRSNIGIYQSLIQNVFIPWEAFSKRRREHRCNSDDSDSSIT